MIGRYDEDVSWVSTHLQGQVPALVMNTADDGTAAYTVPSDSGREAMAFLYFILEHYDCLPEVRCSLFEVTTAQHLSTQQLRR